MYQGATGDTAFGLFAPSLAYVLVDEYHNQLHLIGMFGAPPEADRKIFVGGVEMPAGATWEPRKIVCSLPRSGPGSHGDVQVVVRGRKSNLRQLSRWTLNGTYEHTERGTPFRVDGTMKLIFRADIGEYRQLPGNVFIRPTRYAIASADSEVMFHASGRETESCGDGGVETTTWSGSGSFPIRTGEAIPPEPWHTLAALVINTIDNQAGLGLGFGALDPTQGPLKYTYTPCEGMGIQFTLPLVPPGSLDDIQLVKSSIEATLPDGSDVEFFLPGKTFPLGAGGVLTAGTMSHDPETKFTWTTTTPESPPDPAAAR